MKKQKFQRTIIMAGLVAAMTGSLIGCGKKDSDKKETTTEVATTTEGQDDTQAADTNEVEYYESTDGWTVSYKPADFQINEIENGASFVYMGESAGTNMLSITYVKDKQPEEVLSEITESWGDDVQEDIVRTESFLPGTSDKWGYWRSLPDSTLIAGEYNGGVILFEINTHVSDVENSMPVADQLAEVLNSITYKNFEAQTMYDYIPGTYKYTYSEELDGENVEVEYSIVLNEDHTGTMNIQDSIDIIWSSNELITVDGSSTYEYTIEGNNLMVNFDGEWETYTK